MIDYCLLIIAERKDTSHGGRRGQTTEDRRQEVRMENLEYRMQNLEYRMQNLECRMQNLECRI